MIRCALAVMLLSSACEEKESTPESTRAARVELAAAIQGDLRDKGYGLVTVEATGDDARTLTFGFVGCDEKMLTGVAASPSIQEQLDRLWVFKLECKGGGKVTKPWPK